MEGIRQRFATLLPFLDERGRRLLAAAALTSISTSAWAQYSVLSDRREALLKALKTAGVPTAIYYPLPLHLQPATPRPIPASVS